MAAQVSSQVGSCVICGGQNGTWTNSHSTNCFTFINHPNMNAVCMVSILTASLNKFKKDLNG
jgi:hypothetical protein